MAEWVETDCLGCGKHIKKLKSQVRRAFHYCSIDCRRRHKREIRTFTCESCGERFEAFPSASRRFCSRECRFLVSHPGTYRDGRSRHPQYQRWINMMSRCFRPDHPEYSNYGARGITVCEEWQEPFAFYSYLETLGPCPSNCSLDRIDNDGDYEPGNVRWATKSEQRTNSRGQWINTAPRSHRTT